MGADEPVPQKDETVCKTRCKVEIVQGDDAHGVTCDHLRSDLAQHVELMPEIKRGGRFIEEVDIGSPDQGLCNGNQLRLPP